MGARRTTARERCLRYGTILTRAILAASLAASCSVPGGGGGHNETSIPVDSTPWVECQVHWQHGVRTLERDLFIRRRIDTCRLPVRRLHLHHHRYSLSGNYWSAAPRRARRRLTGALRVGEGSPCSRRSVASSDMRSISATMRSSSLPAAIHPSSNLAC
jgi:hypothetical protein